MKALSVRQPWASLIAAGQKTTELRTWRTHYRGPFLLCSSASKPENVLYSAPAVAVDYPRGVAIALCELYDVRPAEAGDEGLAMHALDRPYFAWRVRVLRRVGPFPIKGRLGFWELDPESARAAAG